MSFDPLAADMIRPCWIVVYLMLIIPSAASTAQSTMDGVGSARAAALGRATTALPGDVGSQANPAAAAARALRSVHLFAHESFGLAELRRGAVNVVLPVFGGTLLGGAGTFGYDAYRESYFTVGGAYGWGFGTSRVAHFGLYGRYYHTSIASYGQAGAVGLTAGSHVQVLPSLSFGVLATNINAPQWAEGIGLPQSLAVGLAYEAAPGFMVVLDALKDIDFPLSVRGGVETRPLPPLVLRAGFTTAPTRFTAGLGVQLGALTADVAAENHQVLGWSPSVGFSAAW